MSSNRSNLLASVILLFMWKSFLQNHQFPDWVAYILYGLAVFNFLREFIYGLCQFVGEICSPSSPQSVVNVSARVNEFYHPNNPHSYLVLLNELASSNSADNSETKTLVAYQGDEAVCQWKFPADYTLRQLLTLIDPSKRLPWRVVTDSDDKESVIVPPDNWPVARLRLVWADKEDENNDEEDDVDENKEYDDENKEYDEDEGGDDVRTFEFKKNQ